MRSFRVGSAFDIPIELDLTFLLVLPLFAYIIGTEVGRWVGILNETLAANIDPGPLTGEPVIAFGLGTLAAIGLFVGVVLHELGHSLTARRYGVDISAITLWLFGGVGQFGDLPDDWKQEVYVAVAGPVVSVVLGVVSYVAFRAIPADGGLVLAGAKFLLGYLAVMNVVLAVFNLLPGFPLDGGRVLRALLARNRPYARATQIAAEVGKGFAILLGLFGLFAGFNLFLVAIAFFIYIGASSEAQQTVMEAAFEGVSVRDIMTPASAVNSVDREDSVAEVVERMFTERHTGYPVTENGRVVGMVTLEDARDVPEVERDAYRAEEIMTTDLHTTDPDADAMDALSTMREADVGRLPVMADEDGDGREELVGIVSRTDLMTAFDIIKTRGSLEGGRTGGDLAGSRSAEPRQG